MYLISTCGNQVDSIHIVSSTGIFIMLIVNCQEEPDVGTCFIKDLDVVLA